MLYVIEDIPSKVIAFEDKPSESLFIELNLQNIKMLTNWSYNSHKSEIKKHLTALRNSSDLCSSKYTNILRLGDFNAEIEEVNRKSFGQNYNLENLIKQRTCYKISNKPTFINLILTICENLDEKDIKDNKKFWKTVESLLSDKLINGDKIHLNENEDLIDSEFKTAELLNNFFLNIAKT